MIKKTFEQNGGYYIDGVPYMDCRVTGEPVRNVSTDTVSVMGSRLSMVNLTSCFLIQVNHLQTNW